MAEIGSFHVGGRRVTVSGRPVETIHFTETASYPYDPNGHFHVEQAYVQFLVPAERRLDLPVVFLHGGGMSGAMWEATPDGRTGWLWSFLAAGCAVCNVDGVERGRAGWCAVDGQWPDVPIIRSEEEAWELFRIGPAEGYEQRVPFPGSRFPVDHLAAFTAQFVPRWTSPTPAAIAAFEAAVERIGPCMVVCHSQGCGVALDVAARRPDLIRATVAVEPSGFPVHYPEELGACPGLVVLGDHLDRVPLFVRLRKQLDQHVAAVAEQGGTVRILDLPEAGITGNSHMIMMDDNAEEIAGMILDWLRER